MVVLAMGKRLSTQLHNCYLLCILASCVVLPTFDFFIIHILYIFHFKKKLRSSKIEAHLSLRPHGAYFEITSSKGVRCSVRDA